MTDLRKAAKGEPCEVRLPGICNFNPETTVLAHVRMAGLTGIGQKIPDQLGAHCCMACHDEADRRTMKMKAEEVELEFLRAVIRTQYKLIKRGLIK